MIDWSHVDYFGLLWLFSSASVGTHSPSTGEQVMGLWVNFQQISAIPAINKLKLRSSHMINHLIT